MSNNSISENESHLPCGDDLPISLPGEREPCDTWQPVLGGGGGLLKGLFFPGVSQLLPPGAHRAYFS